MYKDMVYVLDNVDLVLTDSGALQEEAVSLGNRSYLATQDRAYGWSLGASGTRCWFSPLLIMSGIEQALHQITNDY